MPSSNASSIIIIINLHHSCMVSPIKPLPVPLVSSIRPLLSGSLSQLCCPPLSNPGLLSPPVFPRSNSPCLRRSLPQSISHPHSDRPSQQPSGHAFVPHQ